MIRQAEHAVLDAAAGRRDTELGEGGLGTTDCTTPLQVECGARVAVDVFNGQLQSRCSLQSFRQHSQ
jgi:hypothetical protein